MNNNTHIDINSIDFDDNPIFTHPRDHHFDPEDCYIDREDSYMIANLRAENDRKRCAPASSSKSSWNLKKILIILAVIGVLGFLGFGWIFLNVVIAMFL